MRLQFFSRIIFSRIVLLAVIVGFFGIGTAVLGDEGDNEPISKPMVSRGDEPNAISKPIVYRGKTFDEWVGSPRVEICEEHLAETLAAIGVFGRYGYEDKVFDAVWGLVENRHSHYASWNVSEYFPPNNGNTVTWQALHAINRLPLSCVMPKLKEFAESDRKYQRQFAFAVLFVKLEYGFPEEHWEWVYEQALKRERDDLRGACWSQFLGRCDSSGKLLIRYLTELVKRQDEERFVAAFSPVLVTPQAISMGCWYDWGVSSNRNMPIAHTWYPLLIFGFKVEDQTNTEHVSALREFFTEVGVKSENEAIRLHSTSLLAALIKWFSLDGEILKYESRPTTETYPTTRAVVLDATPSETPWSPSSPINMRPVTAPSAFAPVPEN